MVLVTLVGMVGFSRDAESQNDTPTMNEISNAVSALQARANPTTGAVNELLDYDLDTVYDWETVYALEKVYARVPASAKMYYLTVASFTGGDAITACDSGFHVASISEIQDPNNLQYVNRSTTAYDAPAYDQGFGPPSNHMGWVRSGVYSQSGFAYPCDVYLSSSDQQSGTTMSLYAFWYDPTAVADLNTPHTYMGWHAAHHPCSEPEPVWCVEDPE